MHLSRDVMVLSNARSRPATTGSQRFISFLNTSAPCGRTSSCHDVFRFRPHVRAANRQVPLTVLVLDPQQRCRRDLSWTSESRFCCVLNHHAELDTEDANEEVLMTAAPTSSHQVDGKCRQRRRVGVCVLPPSPLFFFFFRFPLHSGGVSCTANVFGHACEEADCKLLTAASSLCSAAISRCHF